MMETSRTFGRSIMRGLARYGRGHGSWAYYKRAPFYWGGGNGKVTADDVRRLGADGLILREQRTAGLTENILATGLPAVVSPYTEPFEGVPNIVTDDIAIGRMAAEYLLHRGFRFFAYCGFGPMYYWSRQRAKGFTERIATEGCRTFCYEYELPPSGMPHSWQEEQDVLIEWLRGLPQPAGLMACNDDRSQYVLEACMMAGLEVPEQIAVIGVGNDTLVCDLVTPPLSSIALSTERAGYEAAALLDAMMSGRQVTPRSVIVRPTHVVTRRSTDVFAVQDHAVSAALRFIYERAGQEPIQVDDVLPIVALSRRTLYQRFAEILGRSVHEEIKRVRVDQLARLLVSTKLPISQIALSMGCKDIKNIARYFRQQKGMTPSEYRKSHSLQ